MAHPKEDALIKAALAGEAAKVRQLLADGAPVDARDVNRMTAAMLAAQGGHVHAFQALVEAGADLHATAARQFDLLEAAARGGSVEIVTFLLENGLPVDGHWKPANDVMAKMGHDTPLFQAVDFGHVDVVRLLLAKGADRNAKYMGKTAIQIVKERLRDPDYEDEKPQYLAIAALLGETPMVTKRAADSDRDLVKVFATNARQPAYAQLRDRLAAKCGTGRPWMPAQDHGVPAAGVVSFRLANCKRQKVLQDLQQEARNAASHLVLAEP